MRTLKNKVFIFLIVTLFVLGCKKERIDNIINNQPGDCITLTEDLSTIIPGDNFVGKNGTSFVFLNSNNTLTNYLTGVAVNVDSVTNDLKAFNTVIQVYHFISKDAGNRWQISSNLSGSTFSSFLIKDTFTEDTVNYTIFPASFNDNNTFYYYPVTNSLYAVVRAKTTFKQDSNIYLKLVMVDYNNGNVTSVNNALIKLPFYKSNNTTNFNGFLNERDTTYNFFDNDNGSVNYYRIDKTPKITSKPCDADILYNTKYNSGWIDYLGINLKNNNVLCNFNVDAGERKDIGNIQEIDINGKEANCYSLPLPYKITNVMMDKNSGLIYAFGYNNALVKKSVMIGIDLALKKYRVFDLTGLSSNIIFKGMVLK